MQIANSIYDAVFKYLMEDVKSAEILISTIQDEHILTINENDYPEKYHPIIRRLQRAAAEEEIRDIMDIEDDYLEELYDLERNVEKKDKALKENKKALEEKDKVLEENKKALEEKDKLIEQLLKERITV